MLCKINLLAYATKDKNILGASLSKTQFIMPHVELNNLEYHGHIQDLIKELYNTYIILSPQWNFPVLIDNVIVNGITNIEFHAIYSCEIPHNTELKNATYFDISSLIKDSNILKKTLSR